MDNKLEATLRTDLGGKSHARKLRMAGQVPAVIYGGGGEATRVAFQPKQLIDLFDATKNRNTVLTLDVGGERIPVLVGEVQRHPLDRSLVHVDFIRLSKDRPVTVMIPVNPVGRPMGAVAGGRLRVIRRELKARCRYDRIPERFDLDVSAMDIGDFYKASAVQPGDGVEVLFDQDFNVLSVEGKKAEP
ncbi:MAG: 50S ribosomal protein L25, partial [Deltaproteobacteria bacterium]|nr:50S ribosomal protein L25 [Deltaproteobacteria bacterium]